MMLCAYQRLIMRLALLIVLCLPAAQVYAHVSGISKNRLDISELGSGQYQVLWRNRVSSLEAKLPADCVLSAISNIWKCEQPLAGRRIFVENLALYQTDAIVRVAFADESVQVEYLSGSKTYFEMKSQEPKTLAVLKNYIVLGVEHILLGWDHLLFVLGLVLLVSGYRALLLSVTAFTVAHSITLCLSALELVTVPIAPTEAVIALSISLLAVEYWRKLKGQVDFVGKYPAIMALGMGLFHGLGFASVLKDIGLPKGEYITALVAFNVGVEVGQLLFIGVVLSVIKVMLPFCNRAMSKAVALATVYGIGGISAFWFIARTMAIVQGQA